ncbi:MAG: hypothetical protein IRZ05_20290 [Micromonosporaceae bacterium]|nr:hypothetical protein [Micromonosporaceae bacterium]
MSGPEAVTVDLRPREWATAALTVAARQTRTLELFGTRLPVDFADLLAHVVTTVAANVGDVDTLLAGRPDSWQATLVRQLVEGTAGGRLLRWRTEPLLVHLDVDGVFARLGLLDLYREAIAEATGLATTHELTGRARALVDAIDYLMDLDRARYLTAYTRVVRELAAARGATVPVEVVPVDGAEIPWWDLLAGELHQAALRRTPLPMTGTPPDWTTGTPADALRAAGLTYTARARLALTRARQAVA